VKTEDLIEMRDSLRGLKLSTAMVVAVIDGHIEANKRLKIQCDLAVGLTQKVRRLQKRLNHIHQLSEQHLLAEQEDVFL